MSETDTNRKYHRTGTPGGAGCPVDVLTIHFSSAGDEKQSGVLLDAGNNATEVELLRTVAEKLGVLWGEDELGWWAALQTPEFPSWSVRRYDDNGNSFLVEANLTEDQAKSQVATYEAKGHKQMYWARDDSLT